MKEEASNPIPSVNNPPPPTANQNAAPNVTSPQNPANLTNLKETK